MRLSKRDQPPIFSLSLLGSPFPLISPHPTPRPLFNIPSQHLLDIFNACLSPLSLPNTLVPSAPPTLRPPPSRHTQC